MEISVVAWRWSMERSSVYHSRPEVPLQPGFIAAIKMTKLASGLLEMLSEMNLNAVSI
jgi:hypothetical protein